MFKVYENDTQTTGTFSYANNGAAIDLTKISVASVQITPTNQTASAKTFTVVAATDICTATAHGLVTGAVLQVSNSGGGLPTGLSAATNYYPIVIDANTFKLASSLANAQAGTAIDITSAGTGTQTETPTAISGLAVQVQKSNDGLTWINQGSSVALTAGTANWAEWVDPTSRYMRLVWAITAGQASCSSVVFTKGYQ